MTAQTLEQSCEPIFARHETFHPRYGWFHKGFDAAQRSSKAFTSQTAPADLGVGKNMVRAIRFWGKAAKLLEEMEDGRRTRSAPVVPSEDGELLLGENGLDPYLELSASLWLLHWWMLRPPCSLPIWWLAFNQFGPVEFSEEDLLSFVEDALKRSATWQLPAESSLKKDVSCLLRMYAPRSTERTTFDDLLDCPFRELGLLQPVSDVADRYRFVMGSKPSLPPSIITYACIDYLRWSDASVSTSTLSRLVNEVGSPGRVFKLTEDALRSALEAQSEIQGTISVRSVAGIPQFLVDGHLQIEAERALRLHYSPLRECDHRDSHRRSSEVGQNSLSAIAEG